MKKPLLNIGDKISYIARTNPKMDGSDRIPIETEITGNDNGLYKTSSMIAFKYRLLEAVLVSINGVKVKDLFYVIYKEIQDGTSDSFYAKKHLSNGRKYFINSIKIVNNDYIEIHIPSYGIFNADYFDLYFNNNPVEFIDHIKMSII
jgi:hypothetical protein